MKKKSNGFTLAELLIVVAIIAVLVAISIPIFSSQLEKSRESTDLANVRAAYAEVMNAAISDDTNSSLWNGSQYVKTVELKQTKDGWAIDEDLNIGGIKHGDTQHWIGDPGKSCTVSYDVQNGLILNWSGESSNSSTNTLVQNINTITSQLSGGGLWSRVTYKDESRENAMYKYLSDVKATLGNDVGLLKIRLARYDDGTNYVKGIFYTNADKTTYTFISDDSTVTGNVSEIEEGTDLYKYYKLTYKNESKYINSDYAGWWWQS